MPQARARREDEYTPGSASYHNYQLTNKGTPPPAGFDVGKGGVVRETPSGFRQFMDSPLFPLLMTAGIGTGGTALAGGFGGGAGAAAAAAPTIAGPGVTAGLPAAAGAGGGAMASLAKWLPLISQGASIGGGIFAGRQAQNAREQASGGLDFAAMAPLIQALIQQQTTQSAENYAAQKKKAATTEPMQQAMMRLAQSLMPRM